MQVISVLALKSSTFVTCFRLGTTALASAVLHQKAPRVPELAKQRSRTAYLLVRQSASELNAEVRLQGCCSERMPTVVLRESVASTAVGCAVQQSLEQPSRRSRWRISVHDLLTRDKTFSGRTKVHPEHFRKSDIEELSINSILALLTGRLATCYHNGDDKSRSQSVVCETECRSDEDCTGLKKCCTLGCSHICSYPHQTTRMFRLAALI